MFLAGALMVTTSALVSALTRSSEAAMMTTFPTVALFLATPGILVPYGAFPEPVERAMWFFSPLGPFGDVIRTGWVGANGNAGFFSALVDTLPGLGVMSGWLVLSAFAVQRWFRWEPRHG